MADERFWQYLDTLIAEHPLVIDRPAGTAHPRYPEFIYPYDYGYLVEAHAPDGAGMDVWVGSLAERRVTGVICTVDLTKRDSEIKILLGCTPAEARQILATHNAGPQAGLLFLREG